MAIDRRERRTVAARCSGLLAAALLSLAIAVPLPAEEAGDDSPLMKRVLKADGDLERVPLWQWFRELTGENAAFVLDGEEDLADLRVHRTWRKGQTVGQVVYALERHLGRFRVHFERNAVSLVSTETRAAMLRPENRAAYATWVRLGEPSDWRLAPSLMLEFGTGGTQGGCFGLEVSYALARTFDALVRIDSYFAFRNLTIDGIEYQFDGLPTVTAGIAPAIRWIPLPDWTIAPYLQAGIVYNVLSGGTGIDSSAPAVDKSGFGLTGAVGARLGRDPDACFLVDLGLARAAAATCVQFRISFQYGL